MKVWSQCYCCWNAFHAMDATSLYRWMKQLGFSCRFWSRVLLWRCILSQLFPFPFLSLFPLFFQSCTQSDYECGFFFAFSLFLSFVRIIKWYFSQQFSVAIVMTDHIALGSHFYSQLRIKCFLCRTHIKRRSNFFSITTNQNVSCSTQLENQLDKFATLFSH